MIDFFRQNGLFIVIILGLAFLVLRRFRKKKFVPENPITKKKKANALINDWFKQALTVISADTITEELSSRVYVTQNRIDQFMKENENLALYFDDFAIKEIFTKLNIEKEPDLDSFMDFSGIKNAITVSNYYREKIDDWLCCEHFPPYFPLSLYWEIVKGHYYALHEKKEFDSETDIKGDIIRIRRFVQILNIQLDTQEE